jgi:hypothetical protein
LALGPAENKNTNGKQTERIRVKIWPVAPTKNIT